MEWYWWGLLVAALAGFVFVKIKVGTAWMKKQKEKRERRERFMEEED